MSDTALAAAEPAPASEPAPPPAPEPRKAELTAREAVDRAFAAVEADEAARPPRPVQSQTEPVDKKAEPAKPAKSEPAKVEAKPEAAAKTETGAKDAKAEPAKTEAPRAPNGQFAAKEPAADAKTPTEDARPAPRPTSFPDAPARFSPDAKAAWAEAPEAVRAEVHRAVRETEQGIQKYKADADAFNDIRDFDDLAKKSGTSLKQALSQYINIDMTLRRDPMAGLERIVTNLVNQKALPPGTSLRTLAAQIAGQKPDEIASRQDSVINELRSTITRLQAQMTGVTQSVQQQRSQSTAQQVAAFAAEPGHERFEELASDIEFFLKSGRTSDLGEAYRLAERISPAPAAPVNPALPPAAEPAAQPRKAALSVHGAPSSGSDPATRKPPSSATDAVDRAFAQLGL